MVHIIENGSGVVAAQTYLEPTFVTQYLADRNRTGENGWPIAGAEGAPEDAATIAASDYIEQKYATTLNGSKEFRDISLARATLSMPVNPTAGDTVTIGTQTYTFVAALTGADDVLVGTTGAASTQNLIDAILANVSAEGVGYGTGTVANVDATAQAFYGDQLVAFAKTVGTGGNDVVVAETFVGTGSWNANRLKGGADFQYPQPLLFPRANLFDRDGIPVIGLPLNLLFAISEYSVRARTLDAVTSLPVPLVADPTQDPLGGNVTSLREKVGPIEVSTQYQAGTANSGALPQYPAADRYLIEYVRRGGIVIR